MNTVVDTALWLLGGALLSVVITRTYDFVFFRKFDLQEAIVKRNLSASIFFGLMALGVSLIVFAVLMSPSASNVVEDVMLTILWSFGTTFIATIVFYICDKMLLPKVSLEEEIKSGNVAAGLFSGLIYLLVSIIAVSIILT